MSSSSPANATPVASTRPRRSTYTAPGPLTMTSSTAGSDSSGSSGPRPVASKTTRAQRASRSSSGRGRLAGDELPHLRLEVRPPLRARLARTRTLDQASAQRDRELLEGLHGS